ncbi:hypothetical protein ABTI69_21365, partial [Acinetobacter baumannii]
MGADVMGETDEGFAVFLHVLDPSGSVGRLCARNGNENGGNGKMASSVTSMFVQIDQLALNETRHVFEISFL